MEFAQQQQYPPRTPSYNRRMGENPYTDEKVSCVGEEPGFLQEKLSSVQFEYDSQSQRMQVKPFIFEPYDRLVFRSAITKTDQYVDLGGALTEDTTIAGEGFGLFFGSANSRLYKSFIFTQEEGFVLDVASVGRIEVDGAVGFRITDSQPIPNGLVYAADYSPTFIDSSLVNKLWVVTSIAAHTDLTNNPHSVTKAQVGLTTVTDDPQVKKLGSSTVGNVPTWSVTTGDALADTYGVETTLVGGSGYLARADAIKAYVDGMAVGLQIKDPCKAATTANIDLDGTETIDGVGVVADDRVFVKDQSAPEENGLYLCKAGAWVRTDDSNSWAEIVQAYAMIEEGTANAGSSWVCNISSGGALETDPIPVTQFFDVTTYSGDAGIDITGTAISVDYSDGLKIVAGQLLVDILDTASGLYFNGGELALNFLGSGTTARPAHSDHNHDASYDNYDYWELLVDAEGSGAGQEIQTTNFVKFIGGDNITLARSLNEITIHSDVAPDDYIETAAFTDKNQVLITTPASNIVGLAISPDSIVGRVLTGGLESIDMMQLRDMIDGYFYTQTASDARYPLISHTHDVGDMTDISSAGSGSIITSTERTKLSGIATGADDYDHWIVKVNSESTPSEPDWVYSGGSGVVNFIQGDEITITRDGKNITINCDITPADYIPTAAFTQNEQVLIKTYGTIFGLSISTDSLVGRDATATLSSINMTQLRGSDGVSGMLSLGAFIYTEAECNANFAASGHTHDGRYFTETEVTTWRNGVTQTDMGYLSTITSSVQGQLDDKFDVSLETWQTDAGGPATWNLATSRNFEWSMTSSASLTINNAVNGSSGVLILRANGSYTATMPAGSTPATINVTSSENVLAVFTRLDNGNFIWSSHTFLDPV